MMEKSADDRANNFQLTKIVPKSSLSISDAHCINGIRSLPNPVPTAGLLKEPPCNSKYAYRGFRADCQLFYIVKL